MANPIQPFVVETVALDQLKPRAGRKQQRLRHQRQALADSIRSHARAVPVLVDEHNEIIAGHARLEVARYLGWSELPAIRLNGLTKAQKNALRIADSRVAELGKWNMARLHEELQSLADHKFDRTLPAFDTLISTRSSSPRRKRCGR